MKISSRPFCFVAFAAAMIGTSSADYVESPHLYIRNRVTISGKITSATPAIEKDTANTQTTTSKLTQQSITNGTILDLMVTAKLLGSKKGAYLYEDFNSDGSSLGIYVLDGDYRSIKIPDSILPGFLTLPGATAGTFQLRSGQNPFTVRSSFSKAGAVNVFSAPMSVSFTGNTVARSAKWESYQAVNYTAEFRGVWPGQGVLEMKLTSSGTKYTANTSFGSGGTGTINTGL